jgi:hypothetical protein
MDTIVSQGSLLQVAEALLLKDMKKNMTAIMKVIQPIIDWSLWEKFTKLEWTLMVIGGLTLFFVFIHLFTSLSDNTPPPTVTNTLTLKDMPQFEATLATAVNSIVEKGAPITILTNGQEFLPDLLTEIKKCQAINLYH